MIDLGSNNYWSVNAIMANKNSFVEDFMSVMGLDRKEYNSLVPHWYVSSLIWSFTATAAQF